MKIDKSQQPQDDSKGVHDAPPSQHDPDKSSTFDGRVYTSEEEAAVTKIQAGIRGKFGRIEAREARFDKTFTKERKDGAAYSTGINLDEINKIVGIARETLRRWILPSQQNINSLKEEAIFSHDAENGKTEITINVEPIAEGSFGSVYSVFNIVADKPAAFKIAFNEDVALEDIDHEIATLTELRGTPGLTRCHSVVRIDSRNSQGTTKTSPSASPTPTTGYLSPLCSGNLEDIVPEYIDQQISCIHSLLTTLNALHDKGFRHGDVKPKNILMKDPELTGNGTYEAILGDFGGARKFETLEAIFNEGVKEIKEAKKQYKKITVKSYADTLFGTKTRDFCAHSKYNRDLLLDLDEIKEALEAGDFERYKDIEKARDVYAMGLSFLFTFAIEDDYDYMTDDEIDDVTFHIARTETIPDYMRDKLEEDGFNDGQIDFIEGMVHPRWHRRPAVKSVIEVFE